MKLEFLSRVFPELARMRSGDLKRRLSSFAFLSWFTYSTYTGITYTYNPHTYVTNTKNANRQKWKKKLKEYTLKRTTTTYVVRCANDEKFECSRSFKYV